MESWFGEPTTVAVRSLLARDPGVVLGSCPNKNKLKPLNLRSSSLSGELLPNDSSSK
ncbi:Hypothetical predicted protein [Olea europaea subsp. europaea]|uniref:Uncharacterized protein n=1 Tax=Olea europaea subsp. europaea TaxID=158383 RepID=A0A8S0UCZ5_OLEEU|nr:Hypothetical predicted protein [Olea europaea subsp. europaea]